MHRKQPDISGIRGMYEGTKKVISPTKCKNPGPADTDKQMERWVQHYSELQSRESSISNAVLDTVARLSVMERQDALPIAGKLSRAIDKSSREGIKIG